MKFLLKCVACGVAFQALVIALACYQPGGPTRGEVKLVSGVVAGISYEQRFQRGCSLWTVHLTDAAGVNHDLQSRRPVLIKIGIQANIAWEQRPHLPFKCPDVQAEVQEVPGVYAK